MRFLHTSDLHIGKQLHGVSLEDDQRYILDRIIDTAREEKADAILIAGDVFDSVRPSEASVALFNDFLTKAADEFPVYVIPGNHDSADRLGTYRSLLRDNVRICGPFYKEGKMQRCTVTDGHGELNIWLMPYIRTSSVRAKYQDDTIDIPEKAFKKVFEESGVDPSARNILVAHQFVVGEGISLSTSDSEELRPDTLGGADSVSYEVLAPFDYVALGHIHRPQPAGRPTVRYCGSPLKYSESESKDTKGVDIIDIGEKGEASSRHVPLKPLRDLIRLEGTVDEILSHRDECREMYVCAAVHTESSIGNANERLKAAFPHLVSVSYVVSENAGDARAGVSPEEVESRDPAELFSDFFKTVTGRELSDNQRKALQKALERAGAER